MDAITLVEGDLLDMDDVMRALRDCDVVFHLAANPDVRSGATDTKTHFDNNIVATYNLLEGMRKKGVRTIAFTSSSTVYGEASVIPTPEDYAPLIPISIYGASKLASEALISAYCHTFDMRAWIYRFANVIGRRSSHGVIYDFINKIRNNPEELEILGDGNQTKSYIYVDDCIDAMVAGLKVNAEAEVGVEGYPAAKNSVNIFNIGTDDMTTVKRIAEIVCEEMRVSQKPKFKFTGGKRGWKGDVPIMLLDASKLNALGWKQRYNSEEAVRKAAVDLLEA